jgi:hypothetical protein
MPVLTITGPSLTVLSVAGSICLSLLEKHQYACPHYERNQTPLPVISTSRHCLPVHTTGGTVCLLSLHDELSACTYYICDYPLVLTTMCLSSIYQENRSALAGNVFTIADTICQSSTCPLRQESPSLL